MTTLNADGEPVQTFDATDLPPVDPITAVNTGADPPRTAADVIDDAEELLDTADERIAGSKPIRSMTMLQMSRREASPTPSWTILMAQAGLDGIDHGAPQHFMNTTANIVVVVEFQDPGG